ncbi:hypothetical protein [Sphingomonas crocodyli]|nr:hypothetical protein [Sphingomonas crocodyli]
MQPDDNSRWPLLGSNTYTFKQDFDPDALALTLAKIAHACTVAEFGIESFSSFLPPVLLGQQKDIYTYVGSSPAHIGDPTELHRVQLHLGHPHYGAKADYLLSVSICLLSSLGLPTALVIVGRANEQWAQREAARYHSNAIGIPEPPPNLA